MKRLHAIVEGAVQGVCFRDFIRERARQLGLSGWVRNTDDGAAEVMAEGEDVALEHLVLALEKGPPHARVDEVTTHYHTPTGEFADFRVTH